MTRTNSRIATFAALTACLATSIVCQPARAQEGPLTPQPTPEHEILKKDVGTWDATVKFWEKPGGEAQESKATEKNELLPGGLWLVSRFDGEFGPMKFVGLGHLRIRSHGEEVRRHVDRQHVPLSHGHQGRLRRRPPRP